WLRLTVQLEARVGSAVGPPTIERGGTLRALETPADADYLYRGFAAACRRSGRDVPAGLVLTAESAIPVAPRARSSAAAAAAGGAGGGEQRRARAGPRARRRAAARGGPGRRAARAVSAGAGARLRRGHERGAAGWGLRCHALGLRADRGRAVPCGARRPSRGSDGARVARLRRGRRHVPRRPPGRRLRDGLSHGQGSPG